MFWQFLLSTVSIETNVDSAVLSYPMAMLPAALASTTLCLGYMYHLVAYKNFPPGGIQYPQCPLYGTTEAAAEAEAAAALASSDIETKFSLHSDKNRWGRGKGDTLLFLGINEALVASEIFISRGFSWNSRHLEPCHCNYKVRPLERVAKVTFFTISSNVLSCANRQHVTQKRHYKRIGYYSNPRVRKSSTPITQNSTN